MELSPINKLHVHLVCTITSELTPEVLIYLICTIKSELAPEEEVEINLINETSLIQPLLKLMQ